MGFFRRDKFHGHGRLTRRETGALYVGEFEDFNYEVSLSSPRYTVSLCSLTPAFKRRTIRQGEGRLTRDSMHSAGQFRCGKMIGRGVLCNPEAGGFYSGDFLAGKYSGQGRLGQREYVYGGGFRDGQEHGAGVRNFLDA